ncbi:putative cytochrome P450 [Xylariaceae sp. FL0594]|nr:putative cytochrome P450 [Xylariaceae sp. FL0594]
MDLPLPGLAPSRVMAAILAIILGAIIARLLLPRGGSQLNWYRNGATIIHDAYRRYPDKLFRLPSTDRRSVVLPLRYLNEISALPHSVASASHASSDLSSVMAIYFFMGRWTTLDAIRTQYITRLPQQIEAVADELSYALGKSFSNYPDWTAVAIQPKILSIICRQLDWVANNIGYAENVFAAAFILKFIPSALRPVFLLCTPYFYRIHRCRRSIAKTILPHIRQRLEWRDGDPEYWSARVTDGSNSDTKNPVCLVDWLVKCSQPHESAPALIARRLTGASLGATHTTTNHITNCILDLAAHFENIAPILRDEIEQVLGPKAEELTLANLDRMWKLDSFMKEVQRFHPASQLSVNRKLMKPFTLSTGETLPEGTHISFPGVPISMNERHFEDATTFDPFRFERLRRSRSKSGSFSGTDHDQGGFEYTFTTTYPGTLHFGHGGQTCPGRFMGSMLSKLLLVKILLAYDLKLKDGETARPQNIMVGDMDLPNPKSEIVFRNRI